MGFWGSVGKFIVEAIGFQVKEDPAPPPPPEPRREPKARQPALAVLHILDTRARSPQLEGDPVASTAGMIRHFLGRHEPGGSDGRFPNADGRVLQITDFPDLHAAIGTRYGGRRAGTFNIPDLRDTAATGADEAGHVGRMGGLTDMEMSWIICVEGGWPNPFGAFLGMVRLTAAAEPPPGWARCDGRVLPVKDNHALFALIGTTFGGDGETEFALPDLRGRTPVGAGKDIAIGQKTGTRADGMFQTLGLAFWLVSHGGWAGVEDGDYFSDEEPIAGEIVLTAFAQDCFKGEWVSLDGSVLPAKQHQLLQLLLGADFGGDGKATVGVPDIAGKILVGAHTPR